jgi:hypothetical protein
VIGNDRKNRFCLLAILVFIFGFCVMTLSCGGGSGGGDDDEDDNQAPLTHNEMLNTLGVDTNIGARENPSGEPVSDDYNPTLRGVTQLAKRSEIFLAGTRGQGGSTDWTPDSTVHTALDWSDGATDFDTGNMSGDDSWLQLPKAMASGDLDGDGIDEIFIAYMRPSNQFGYDKELAFKVIKIETGQYSVVFEDTVALFLDEAISEYPDDYWWMNNFNVACGDLDGNSQKETLIGFNGFVYLMGDSYKDYGLIDTISYPKVGDTRYKLIKISAGDLDNDGMDEFVVVENSLKSDIRYGAAMYHIYTGITLDELDSGTITVTEDATTRTLHSSSCAVGDLDGDGLNEILFIGEPEFDATYYMMILEPEWNEDSDTFEFSFKPDFEFFEGRNSYLVTPICAIADFDGDGKNEFMGYRRMYENLSETGGAFAGKSTVPDIYTPTNAGALGSAWDTSLAVGDFDGDMKADIAFVTDGFYELFCLGFNDSGAWVRKGTGDIFDWGGYYPYVTMGDYDGDSIVVEYLESETLFSNPHPVVVMAANPFWSELGMDGETSFGTTTGSEVEREKSIGFSVGFSIGYESSGPFGLWSASVKMSFESSFDWTATESVSIDESYTYSTINEDKVVFTTIPYDVYYYRVIQAPDPDMLDEVITVNLPRKPVTLPVECTYYNTNNGQALDIDSTILTHSIGNPLSYPTSGMTTQLIAQGGGEGIQSTNMLTVGQGTGYTSIDMSVVNANGSGFAFDFSVTIEAEGGAFGFTAGTSSGFHYGESYSITTSDGMLYGGAVSNIPAEYWDPDMAFSWGLFSYRATLGNEKFIVVQYYTETL